ncbi:hypothetical protein PAMP_011511 [Pampus punctatissimus]
MAQLSSGRDLLAPERSGSGRTEAEPRTGEQPEQLVYLTCLPERYRAAKFSLAAYLLCWALLRWYKASLCSVATEVFWLTSSQTDPPPHCWIPRFSSWTNSDASLLLYSCTVPIPDHMRIPESNRAELD